ncbi:MAG: TRAM domain-containing protein, partial [Nanoarchaeota archaeon]
MNEQQEPPVQVGETYTVSIDAVGGKGDGIAKVKGFVVFVPGVQKG